MSFMQAKKEQAPSKARGLSFRYQEDWQSELEDNRNSSNGDRHCTTDGDKLHRANWATGDMFVGQAGACAQQVVYSAGRANVDPLLSQKENPAITAGLYKFGL